MTAIITFLLSNFTLTFLVIGLACSLASLAARRRRVDAPAVVEALFSYFLLFSVGIASLYNAFFKLAMPEMAARLIGWADSPFQQEVGFANLGFGLVAILAFKGSFGLRIAAVVGPACFLLGAASVHIYEMVVAQNFAPGNAGVIFYTDIGLPLMGFILLWLQYVYAMGRKSQHVLSPLP